VENGFRAIFVPELAVPSEVPSSLGERMRVKTRRAVHLTGLWVQCLKSLVKGRPGLPRRIAVPEVFISLFDPFVFFVLACTTIILSVFNPVFSGFRCGCVRIFGSGSHDSFILCSRNVGSVRHALFDISLCCEKGDYFLGKKLRTDD